MKWVALLLCLVNVSYGMEEPGNQPPVPYYYFSEPIQFVRQIAQYLPPNPVIVHAGAYDGRECCTLAQFWPMGHIHAFEPVSSLYKVAVEKTKQYSNISVYPLALGEQSGESTLFHSTETFDPEHVSMSSSLYPPKDHLLYSGTIFRGSEVVNVTTLDNWAESHQIDQVDMLWLDMQGTELAALKSGTKLLSKVSAIMVELEFVEAYEGQPQYHEIKSWLEAQGFQLIGGTFSFPKAPRQWFGNGLFIRREKVR